MLGAKLILCDYAQVADGKLNVIGAGWSFTGPQPCPSALAVMIDVPWSATNERHELALELLTADGEPVGGPEGAVRLGGQFEVGRPAGHPAGVGITVPLAFNIGPIALTPGARYVWVLTIDDETRDDWRATFTVRPE